jgi:hypothetical protein
MRTALAARGAMRAGLGAGEKPVPLQIVGCQAWYAANLITGMADGDALGTWVDASGYNRNLTQATAGAKPAYKTGIANGYPVIRFGGDDNLSASFADVGTQSLGFIVFLSTTGTPNGQFGSARFINFGRGGGANNNRCYTGAGTLYTSGKIGMRYGAAADPPYNTTGNVPTSFAILSFGHDSTTAFAWLNGTQVLSTAITMSNDGTTRTVTLGGDANGYLSGDVAEVIIYNVALTTADRLKIQAYLAGKYNITIS